MAGIKGKIWEIKNKQNQNMELQRTKLVNQQDRAVAATLLGRVLIDNATMVDFLNHMRTYSKFSEDQDTTIVKIGKSVCDAKAYDANIFVMKMDERNILDFDDNAILKHIGNFVFNFSKGNTKESGYAGVCSDVLQDIIKYNASHDEKNLIKMDDAAIFWKKFEDCFDKSDPRFRQMVDAAKRSLENLKIYNERDLKQAMSPMFREHFDKDVKMAMFNASLEWMDILGINAPVQENKTKSTSPEETQKENPFDIDEPTPPKRIDMEKVSAYMKLE